MKKFVAVLMTVLLAGFCSVSIFAGDTTDVYVTIADGNGQLVLARKSVAVTDADGDGVLSIYDALYSAHEAAYEGGAEAGFGAVTTEYGLSMTRLWGVENGGSYGYYVNNASAWSLLDPVKEGDFINAFVYTDLTAWSDTFCFFDAQTMTASASDPITLTLNAAGYDADYNPISVPVANAALVINGEKTDFVTDAEGKVTFSPANAGDYTISAVSDTQTLVPPVCMVQVTEAAVEAPATGDVSFVAALAAVASILAGGTVLVRKKRA